MNEISLSLSAHNLGQRLKIDGRPFIGGVCLHDTAGTGTHNDTRYLANPGDGRKVSVDFTVERDGAIYQLNPDLLKYCTFHAGRATKWTTGGRVFRNRQVTQVLIGIELVQKANMSLSPVWSDKQVQSVAELCVYLCRKFDLKKEQITTHARVITDGSRSDPRNFPIGNFWNAFNAAAGGSFGTVSGQASGSAGLAEPVVHTVKAGETLWSIAKLYGTTIEFIKAVNNLNDPANIIRPGQNLIVKK